MKINTSPSSFWGRIFYWIFNRKMELLLRRKNLELARDEKFNKQTIQLLPNETVEIVAYEYKLIYDPWPIFIQEKKLIKTLNKTQFYEYVFEEIKAQMAKNLSEAFVEEYQKNFNSKGDEAINLFFNILLHAARHLFENQFIVDIKDPSWESTEAILNDLVTGVLRKFKKELAEASTGKFNRLFKSLSQNIVTDLEQLLSQQQEDVIIQINTSEELLPQNTRFYSTKGRDKVIVVEQMPMVRNIFFGSIGYQVAFPFVIFVIKLESGQFKQVHLFYRNSPLRSIEDELYNPNLTNIYPDQNNLVCWGKTTSLPKGTDTFQQVNEVIELFWSSRFNTDLNQSFNYYSQKDSSLGSFEAWETASKKNARFPLTIKWKKAITLERLLLELGCFHNNSSKSRVKLTKKVKQQIEDLVSLHQSQITQLLQRLYGEINIENKVEKLKSKTTEVLTDHQTKLKTSALHILSSILGNMSKPEFTNGGADLDDILATAIKEVVDKDTQNLVERSTLPSTITTNTLIEKITQN